MRKNKVVKILYIFCCENCHTLMKAEPSVFISVTCIKPGFLESSLSPTEHPKSVSHLSAGIRHALPSLYSFIHILSLSLSLFLSSCLCLWISLSSPLLFFLLENNLAYSWLLPFSSPLPHTHTSFSKTEAMSQAKRTKDLSSMEGEGSVRLWILYTTFSWQSSKSPVHLQVMNRNQLFHFSDAKKTVRKKINILIPGVTLKSKEYVLFVHFLNFSWNSYFSRWKARYLGPKKIKVYSLLDYF